MTDSIATEEVLPNGWLPLDEQVSWLKDRMIRNGSYFVLSHWDCKYVNLRIDMRNGMAIISPGNT